MKQWKGLCELTQEHSTGRGRGIKCRDDHGAGSIEIRDTLSPQNLFW